MTDYRTIDRRADMAACLQHHLRRRIRDVLRSRGPLTLTEITKIVGTTEPNVYNHLQKMIDAGIVTRFEQKINGRMVAFYTLSSEYDRLFSNEQPKPDLTPIYILFFSYLGFTLVSVCFGQNIVGLLKFIGIYTVSQLLTIALVGLVTSAIPLIYYVALFVSIDNFKSVLKKIREAVCRGKV